MRDMTKKYNILWIDDEWDKMSTFKQECDEMHDLNLVPFRTRKAGMDALEHNLDYWDAVLLDAKMFDESDNEVASLTGLGKAKAQLDRLSLKRVIPYFISTGQPDLLDSENFKDLFGEFFEKDKDDDKLIEQILSAIKKTESLHIKAMYSDIFASLETLGISEYTESILQNILLPLHYTEKLSSFIPVYHYNQLRQLIEYLFRVCHQVGLIPDQCVPNGLVNLNQCSMYLAGRNPEKAGVRYGEGEERVVPEYIEKIIRSVLDFGNVHSHTVELDANDTIIIENILKSSRSRYLIFGLALQICELVTWFADYIPTHSNKEENLAKCKPISDNESGSYDNSMSKYEDQIFVPEQDEDGIWHCEECMIRISFWSSGKMRLKNITKNTNKKSNGKYPYYAVYEKVEEE